MLVERGGLARPAASRRRLIPLGSLLGRPGRAEIPDPVVVGVPVDIGARARVTIPAPAATAARGVPVPPDGQWPARMLLAGWSSGAPIIVVIGAGPPQILLILRPSRSHEARYS